jgi:hypothetical protein
VSNKALAVNTAIIILLITLAAILTETYTSVQVVNPVAALAAVTVALVGVVWFKKTSKK